VKRLSLEVVEGGGIVRAIHNHGIRDLPHRFKAKYADKEGNRYYSKGRFFSIYYDSNPGVMKQVEQLLKMEEDILRITHVKARSVFDYVNMSREERNPYVQKVKRMQAREEQQQRKRQQQEQPMEEAMANSDSDNNNNDDDDDDASVENSSSSETTTTASSPPAMRET
jgi:ribosomal protein S6